MSRLCVLKRFGFSVLAAAGLLVASSSPALAQASVSGGVDFTNNYIFRGIPQTKDFVSSQPWVEVGGDLGDSASVTVGVWNSLFDAPDGTPGSFYESDFYAGVGFTAGAVGVDVSYIAYTSPSDWWDPAVHEIDLGFSFDNPAAPYATIAFEAKGGADGGDNKGTYLELGMEPSYGPLSFPVALGMSLNNYYEVDGEDNAYGFFSVGLTATAPVNDYLELWGGASIVNMGKVGGETTQGVVSFGLSLSN